MRIRTARWGLSAAVLVVAGLALTACGPEDATDAASTGTPAATSTAQAGRPAAATSSDNGQSSSSGSQSGAAKQSGVKCTDQINYAGDPRSNAEINSIGEETGTCPAVESSDSSGSSDGSGGSDDGRQSTLVGKMSYLAPGKLIVKPDNGGTDQAFMISNATTVLGAAAICGADDGNVTMDSNGYGTTKCTVDQLETAAKTGAVTVRVTLDSSLAAAVTIAEKYHP
jgi:hypothetical protein